jgi:hypothetical protein
LPNYDFDKVFKLLAKNKEEKCPIIYSRSDYGSDKKWVSDKKNAIFKYPLIHSTPKEGIRYMYSSKNDNGHFGIKKIIFGESGIYNTIIDMKGEYGITQCSMAIKVNNEKEARCIKNYIESKDFNDILQACSWSNFRIDWRLFTFFKKDFYKYFIEKRNAKSVSPFRIEKNSVDPYHEGLKRKYDSI